MGWGAQEEEEVLSSWTHTPGRPMKILRSSPRRCLISTFPDIPARCAMYVRDVTDPRTGPSAGINNKQIMLILFCALWHKIPSLHVLRANMSPPLPGCYGNVRRQLPPARVKRAFKCRCISTHVHPKVTKTAKLDFILIFYKYSHLLMTWKKQCNNTRNTLHAGYV